LRLLTDGKRVVGAFGYWREQGRFVVLKAKSIVVASGGIGKAWPITIQLMGVHGGRHYPGV